MIFFKKISKKRILPKRYSVCVRVLVALAVFLVSASSVKQFFIENYLLLNHVDLESGITCKVSSLSGFGSVSCEKNPSIGLSLREVDLQTKKWEYSLGDNDWVEVEREGFSMGLRVRVKSNMFDNIVVNEINYEK
ncbi:hypothetical protein QTV49_000461 [Vibrio vulnificus]|nr:hypothetical protein [Vibrio vulnificus]